MEDDDFGSLRPDNSFRPERPGRHVANFSHQPRGALLAILSALRDSNRFYDQFIPSGRWGKGPALPYYVLHVRRESFPVFGPASSAGSWTESAL